MHLFFVDAQHVHKPFRLFSDDSPDFFNFFALQQGRIKSGSSLINTDVLNPASFYFSCHDAIFWKHFWRIKSVIFLERYSDMKICVAIILSRRNTAISVMYQETIPVYDAIILETLNNWINLETDGIKDGVRVDLTILCWYSDESFPHSVQIGFLHSIARLISPFGSAITVLHFLHFSSFNGS